MDYVKTAEDTKIELNDLKTDKIMKWLRDPNVFKFKVGDILIKESRWTQDRQWEVSKQQCGLAIRYVYAFENELGIGYVRRIAIKGDKCVEHPVAVTSFDPDLVRFQLAPEVMEHLLLGDEGDEVDLKSDYKAVQDRRNLIKQTNKARRIKFKKIEDAIAQIESMKVGDTFWFATYINGMYKIPFVVTAVLKDSRFPMQSHIQYVTLGQPVTSWSYRTASLYPETMKKGYFFTEKPMFKDDDEAV
jgi:hypothetical protein